MKNSNNNPSKGKKENQLIFVEYEKPTKEGHLITVVDSYHNTLGRINRSYNEQTKKYEFTAYDHTGKPLYMTSEKIWELKNQFTDNRTQLLDDAHQRRIESKQNSRSSSLEKGSEKSELKKDSDKIIEIDKKSQTQSQPEKSGRGEPNFVDGSYFQDRENEIEALRENESGRKNQELSR